MAQKSRKARYLAQTKRENSILRRDVLRLNQGIVKANGLLLALLMQEGGDYTFTLQTLERLGIEGIAMGYELKAHDNGNLTLQSVVVDPVLLEQIHTAVAQRAEGAKASAIILTDGRPDAS